MIFTLGDIIVLLVVVAVLIIYRQIDRNNRSLDKIKRYAEKVIEDLGSFVESKTDDLKNAHLKRPRPPTSDAKPSCNSISNRSPTYHLSRSAPTGPSIGTEIALEKTLSRNSARTCTGLDVR